MANYQTLEVWKKGMVLVKDIYQFAKILPKEEMFGLTSQIKRSVSNSYREPRAMCMK